MSGWMWTTWFDDESGQWACYAPPDADKEEVLQEIISDADGMEITALAEPRRGRLLDALYFLPLFSVVKADVEDQGLEEGAWNSHAQGKRMRPAWFIDSSVMWAVLREAAS